MKPKPLRKLRLFRAADAFLPLALLIASLRPSAADPTLLLLLSYGLTALLSLASGRALRIAFAVQPSIRSVRGSVKTALILQTGAGLLAGLFVYIYTTRFGLPAQLGEIARESRAAARFLAIVGAGYLLNIEHTFYEYMYATGDGGSAALSRGITAVLTAGGLMIAESGGALWLPGAAAVSALVACVTALAIGGRLKGSLNAGVVRCAPRALVQTFLYPLAAAAILLLVPSARALPAALAGLVLWEICRTPFRRSHLESGAFRRNLLILLAVSAAAAAAGFIPGVPAAAAELLRGWGLMIAAAAVCSLATYAPLR